MLQKKEDKFVSGVVYLEAKRIIPTLQEVRAYETEVQLKEGAKEAYDISVKYTVKNATLYFKFKLLREYIINVSEKLEYFTNEIEEKLSIIMEDYSSDNSFRKELIDLLKEQQKNKEFHILGEFVEGTDYSKEIEKIYMKELNPINCIKKMAKVNIKDEKNEVVKTKRKIRPLTFMKEKLTKTTPTPLIPR